MPDRVSEPTRERVYAAVRETGYSINQAARSLRLKAARTILIAAPDIGNPFYSTILEAVIREASGRGYSVLVATRIGDDPNRWLSDYLLSNRADGLLLFDGSLDTNRLHGLGDGVSLPLVAAYDELPDPQINSVLTDNKLAAMRAIEHLIELGHRRIGHVIGVSRNQSTNERLLGFLEAMQQAGLAVRPEWLIQGHYNLESGAAAAERLLSSSTELPTAVFCANDEMAVGFIHRMRVAGIECPRDISVVGFDDIAVSGFFDPPLTTMRQPREEIGCSATRMLIDIIEGVLPDHEPAHVVLRAELVVRESARRI